MEYKLTLPTDFFGDRLNAKMLQGIVRDLRSKGIELHFDIPKLELMILKTSGSFEDGEFDNLIADLKDLLTKHYESNY